MLNLLFLNIELFFSKILNLIRFNKFYRYLAYPSSTSYIGTPGEEGKGKNGGGGTAAKPGWAFGRPQEPSI